MNAVCAEANAKVTALPTSTGNSVSGLEKVFAIASAMLASIHAVTPPSPMAAEVKSWLAVQDKQEGQVGKALAALRAGSAAQAQSIATSGDQLSKKSDTQAKRLGVPACAETPTPSGS